MLPTYLINLDRSKERLTFMETEFARVGVPFIRFPAFDGAAMSQDEVERWVAKRPYFAASEWFVGDVGLFRSHLSVWQEIAAGTAAAAAVFEDDVHLGSDLGALLSSRDWIPADADIVRLESNSKMVLRNGRSLGVLTDRKLYRVFSSTWGTAGYIITKTAAARLSDLPSDQHAIVDTFLFKPTRSPVAASLRCYQVLPAMCIQDNYLNGQHGRLKDDISGGLRQVKPPPKPRFYDGLIPGRKRTVPFRL